MIASGPEREIKRRVVVITGFGGGDTKHERQAILDVMRIKYLVEQKVEVMPQGRSTGRKTSYEVGVFRAPIGSIPDDALAAIDRADVLLALITEQSVNVIYELAIRNLLHDEFVIVVRGDYRKFLPIYLHGVGHIEFQLETPPPKEDVVYKQIESTAAAPLPPLQWNALHGIPPEVAKAIDDGDDRLKSELQDALQRIEDGPPRRPAFLSSLVRDLAPGRILRSWQTYGPYSILRVKWKQKSGAGQYLPEDLDGDVVVYSANDDYFRLFDFAEHAVLDADGKAPVTFNQLMNQVKGYIEADHLKQFEADQAVSTQRIVFEGRFDQVRVPLRFNGRHPSFPNKVLLPQLIGKRTVGDTNAPHATFLLVYFVEDFSQTDEETTL